MFFLMLISFEVGCDREDKLVFIRSQPGGGSSLIQLSLQSMKEEVLEQEFDKINHVSISGNRLLYIVHRYDGQASLYAFDLLNSNETEFTRNEHYYFTGEYSPSGSRIAFSSNRYGNADLFVMNGDGLDELRLTNNKSNEFYPR